MIPRPPRPTITMPVIRAVMIPAWLDSTRSLPKLDPQRLQNLSPGVTGPPQAAQYITDPFVCLTIRKFGANPLVCDLYGTNGLAMVDVSAKLAHGQNRRSRRP